MMDVIMSISVYIIAAILLGFTFGWFMAKALLKEKFENQIEALSTNYDANKDSIDTHSKEQDKELVELKDKIVFLVEYITSALFIRLDVYPIVSNNLTSLNVNSFSPER